MKLVIGAEVDGPVYELFRPVRKIVQDRFNAVLELEDYGDGLPKFHFIAIIRAADAVVKYQEIYKYNAKKKSCDYRVAIDYIDFLTGNDERRIALLHEAIEKALSHLVQQKTESIDLDRLRNDFIRLLTG